MNRLSYSKISKFLKCPYLYKWEYVDKKEVPEGKELVKGKFLHIILERYVNHLVQIKHEKDFKFFDETVNWLWDNSYKNILSQEDLIKIKQCILKYIENGINYRNILGIEKFFDIYFPELILKLTLRVDRIDQIDGNGIKIIDYKSGDGSFFDDNDLQPVIYSYAIKDLFKLYNKFELEWVYPVSGIIRNIPVIPQEEAKKIILEKSEMVLKEKEFKPRRNQFCNWCHIKKIGLCPLMKGVVENG